MSIARKSAGDSISYCTMVERVAGPLPKGSGRITAAGSDVLAVRWNGKGGDKLGSPQSRGRPTWFIVPEELEPAIRAVISNRRDRTSDPPPGGGPEELPTGPGAGALMEEPAAASQEAAVTAQEWVAFDKRADWADGYQTRPITRSHENRQECIADAKRKLEISPDGELPRTYG